MAKRLLGWTAGSIVVLSVACVFMDKMEDDLPELVKLDSQTVTQITSEIDKTNILLKSQSVEIGEMNNSMTGILGLAKGTLKLAPTMKPSFNIQPGKTRLSRKLKKDTIEIGTRVNTNDSLVITINSGDSIMPTPTNGVNPNSLAVSKCCCCHCCCKGCGKEECR